MRIFYSKGSFYFLVATRSARQLFFPSLYFLFFLCFVLLTALRSFRRTAASIASRCGACPVVCYLRTSRRNMYATSLSGPPSHANDVTSSVRFQRHSLPRNPQARWSCQHGEHHFRNRVTCMRRCYKHRITQSGPRVVIQTPFLIPVSASLRIFYVLLLRVVKSLNLLPLQKWI